MPVRTDDEFGEVPLYFASDLRIRGLVGEELVERCLVTTFYGNFRHDRKSDVVLRGTKRFDFLVRTGLLAAEIVRRDSDDHQAPIFIFFVDFFERRVLGRKPAAARDVDQQQDLTLEFGERGRLAVDGIHREVKDRFFAGHGHRSAQKECKQESPHVVTSQEYPLVLRRFGFLSK